MQLGEIPGEIYKETKKKKTPTKNPKTKKHNCRFEEPGAKAWYRACPLRSTPPKGRADHLSHPSGQTRGHTPVLCCA